MPTPPLPPEPASPGHTPDVYQLEPFLQRPDWEPLRDAGCVTINGKRIFEMSCAQAAFIIRAVNSHAALFDALQDCFNWLAGPNERKKCKAETLLEILIKTRAALAAAAGSK
jgi:hypothetical protein